MTDPQQTTEEVPFHILDGAAKQVYEARFPGQWDSATPSTKQAHRELIATTVALPMLRRYFTAQVEEEPRYTLGQVGACADQHRGTLGRLTLADRAPGKDWDALSEGERMSWEGHAAAAIEALLDLLITQQPVGVGADGQTSGAGVASLSDSEPRSADSDGDHQPLGGDDWLREVAVTYLNRALTDRIEIVRRLGIAVETAETKPEDWDDGAMLALVREAGKVHDLAAAVDVPLPAASTQQPSDGQEDGAN